MSGVPQQSTPHLEMFSGTLTRRRQARTRFRSETDASGFRDTGGMDMGSNGYDLKWSETCSVEWVGGSIITVVESSQGRIGVVGR